MNRLVAPKILVLLIFAVLIGRLYQLQMVEEEADQYRYRTEERVTRYLPLRPLRGEVFAGDGTTLLAETVPIYAVSVRPADLPPRGTPERARVFAQLSQLLGMPGTLTVSPTTAIEREPSLRTALATGLDLSLPLPGFATARALALPIRPAQQVAALRLSETYSEALTLDNPIAAQVEAADIPGYQTLRIMSGIRRETALVLRENAPSLPGVVIEQDYRRSYPLSAHVPSLSYLLGYIRPVNQCDLVRQNTARSWTAGLLDSLGNAVECGIIQKQVNPYELGMPRYLPDDRIGKAGVEASYEADLRGAMGVQKVVVDALGRPVRAPQDIQLAQDGANIMLTVDVALQQQTEQILQNWIAESDRRRLAMSGPDAYKKDYPQIASGVAIVMEVRTGRLLALVNWPAYDNNIWDPSRAEELQKLFFPQDPERLREAQRLALQTNRAISGQYPPGSTLKQFDALVALQAGVITTDTRVRDPGRLVVEDEFVVGRTYEYPNSSRRDNEWLTVSDALKVSSNVFFMTVTGGNSENVVNLKDDEKTIPQGLGPTQFAEGLGWFGLGQPTGIRLVGEAPGRVPTPSWMQQTMRRAWTTGDTYNAAIGQGNLEVTPIQLITAAAAVANNGTLLRPQIVRAVTDAEGQVVHEVGPEVIRQIPADPAFFLATHDGMRRSVTEGSNVAARNECSGLSIAGKTGTAEFGPEYTVPTRDGTGERQVRQSHAWFTGFAPYENPQIAVLVLVEGAGDMNDGSATIAVPAATQIMQAYFGITPPTPLPRGCQQGLPPLPPRVAPAALLKPPVPLLDPKTR
jgi:penicillin-binding protein 2